MGLDWLWLGFILLGHVGVFVVVVNVVHALGMHDDRMSIFKIVALSSLFLVSPGFVYATVQGPWASWPIVPRLYAAICLLVALVGIPVTSLRRILRKPPSNVTERIEDLDLGKLHGHDALIGEGRHSWLLRIPGNESLRISKREWEIVLPSLPPQWDGLSILQLTDLHFAPCYRRLFFDLVLEEARRWESDLVFFTGDLVDHNEVIDWIAPLLSGLHGRLGTYSILGNHDYDQDHLKVSRQLVEAGFTDLEGRWGTLDIEGKRLALGGTSYPWGPKLDMSEMPDADFRILLSHSPDLFFRAVSANIDLMLSGHNHGGQIRLPLVGPVFMPSLYSRHFDRGFFTSRRTLLHVGQGIGAKHPIRYGGCVPEIGRFVLRAAEERPNLKQAVPYACLQESTETLVGP